MSQPTCSETGATATALKFAVGILVLIAVSLVAATGWATDVASEAATRRSLVAGAGLLCLVGLATMGVRKAWSEMDVWRRVGRIAGVAMVGLGVFAGLYGLTEVPPGGQQVDWVESYQTGLEHAEETQRPLVVDFTADWCTACQELDAEVFQHPEIRPRLEQQFVPVKIDYDKADDDTRRAVERFEVSGLPTVAFETSDGEFLRGVSFEGKVDVDDFDGRLDQALSGEDDDVGGWLEQTLGDRGSIAIVLLVFGAGILASLSPCIYPLIPVTIGVLGARDATTRRQGLLLSTSYVGGMVVMYSVLGMVAAMLGTVFGGFFQNLWFQAVIATVFIVLGLGCLGVYNIRLPASIQKRVRETGGGGHAGAFVMGMGAGVLAVPCVGPVVAGILVYVADRGEVLVGGGLLTVFAIGMGLLFLVVGTFSSLIQQLPRAGGWMEGVKAIFGAVFLGLGAYYLRLVVPGISEWTDEIWLILSAVQ